MNTWLDTKIHDYFIENWSWIKILIFDWSELVRRLYIKVIHVSAHSLPLGVSQTDSRQFQFVGRQIIMNNACYTYFFVYKTARWSINTFKHGNDNAPNERPAPSRMQDTMETRSYQGMVINFPRICQDLDAIQRLWQSIDIYLVSIISQKLIWFTIDERILRQNIY